MRNQNNRLTLVDPECFSNGSFFSRTNSQFLQCNSEYSNGNNTEFLRKNDKNCNDLYYPVSEKNNKCLSKFGQFEDNYGWIMCESKSFPGKMYYFNINTNCTTWVRPVSKKICLPTFSKLLYPGPSDDEYDLISSNERDNDEKNVQKRIFMTNLTELNGDSSVNDSLWSDFVVPISPEAAHFVEANYSPCAEKESIDIFQLKKSPAAQIKRNYDSTGYNSNDSSICSCVFCAPKEKIMAPRIKILKRLDNLVKKDILNNLKEKPKKKKKSQKIISEMYGTRTVNYNSDVSEIIVPTCFKASHLSDSSVTTSTIAEKPFIAPKKKSKKRSLPFKFVKPNTRPLKKLVLSETSSSSSSSSSSCSCSSSSTCSSCSSSSGSCPSSCSNSCSSSCSSTSSGSCSSSACSSPFSVNLKHRACRSFKRLSSLSSSPSQ
ncbi:uncharacterized protein [Prorops nasuta]|uniref:uncharacterized protein isoform X2 n=1 Tax=Prorops nasuta TaxID=863751 RepID=UPI0034CFB820